MDADLKAEILALAAKHKAGRADALDQKQLNRSTCQRKVPYTYERARRAARNLGRRFTGRAHPYKCRDCGYWHVANGTFKKSIRQQGTHSSKL
jgi:hypothetical protein